jgi:ketosteroid isomerase-like protein
MLEQFGAGDVEGWIGLWSQEAEWTAAVFEAVEGQPRVYRRHEGLRRFHADALEAFADLRVDPSEFRDAGDLVLVLGKLRAKGAASGAAFEAPMAWLFEVQDGVIVRERDYLDQDEALRLMR